MYDKRCEKDEKRGVGEKEMTGGYTVLRKYERKADNRRVKGRQGQVNVR